MRYLLSCLFILSFIAISLAQSNGESKKLCDSTRLDIKRPSAFITFERYGNRKPRYEGESNEGVWLRFHNNTRWKMTVKTVGVDKEYGDFGIFYEVKVQPLWKDRIKESNVLVGYRMAHISSVYTLESGKTFLFSIPKEHLAEGLYIVTDFSYEWEQHGDSGGGVLGIIHQATFFSTDLPSSK